jgi:hypothetical protein
VGHPDLRLIPLIERTRSGCGVVAEFFAHGGPVTFQVTGATAPTIVVVVRRLPDQTTWGKDRQRRPAEAARRSPALS